MFGKLATAWLRQSKHFSLLPLRCSTAHKGAFKRHSVVISSEMQPATGFGTLGPLYERASSTELRR